MHDDDAAVIDQAVDDEGGHRRRDRGALELQFADRAHETDEPFLLLEKVRDDPGGDVAARGMERRPRLDLPPRVRTERRDDQQSEEARQHWYPLPQPLAPPAGQGVREEQTDGTMR